MGLGVLMSAISRVATTGGKQSDLNSIPSIHWGAFLNNMADPGDIFGGSGSNIGANMTNPAGFAAIGGDSPNNRVNPVGDARQSKNLLNPKTGMPFPTMGANPYLPTLPQGWRPMAAPMPGQISFARMPGGQGAPAVPSYNPFLASLMQYMQPPPARAAPTPPPRQRLPVMPPRPIGPSPYRPVPP